MARNLDTERIIWTDVESTGLYPWYGSRLLQIAIIVTDGHFNELATHESKLKLNELEVEELRAATEPHVDQMHEQSGLWSALTHEDNIHPEAWDEHIQSWLMEKVPTKGSARMGGNSITLDRNHLSFYLPKSAEYFSYQNLDMTSVEYYLELTTKAEPFKKSKSHEALQDIRECIEQARHHKLNSLNNPPF